MSITILSLEEFKSKMTTIFNASSCPVFLNKSTFIKINKHKDLLEDWLKHDIYLLKVWVSIFNGNYPADEEAKLCANYQSAYFYLKSKDLISTRNTKEETVEARFLELSAKLVGDCKIPSERLEALVNNARKPNGTKDDYYLDFFEFSELFQECYGFNLVNGLFEHDWAVARRANELASLGWTLDKLKLEERMSSTDSIDAAKLAILHELYNLYEKPGYASFWHYLLANDFKNIHNGSRCSIYRKNQKWKPVLKNGRDCFGRDDDLFALIRTAFFKEIDQLSVIVNNCPNRIPFLISW